MWNYSETVKEHFYNPKNAGAVDDANAIGDVGSISCGDALRLTLKIDTSSDVIQDAGFQTFGCGSAIASSSALTEMVKGKTVDQALQISNQDIANFLDGLPPEKMHCSVMGREALHAAVANYRGEEWLDDHEEGALVCKCFAIDDVMIRNTVEANSLKTVEDVTNYTKAGGGCSSCHEGIENILAESLAERGESFVAAAVSGKKIKPALVTLEKQPAEQTQSTGTLTLFQRVKKIEQVIEAIRPSLRADGGDCELLDVDGKNIYVNLVGACSGCQMAAMTVGGIQQKMTEALGEFVQVISVDRENLVKRQTAVSVGGV